MRKGPPFPVKAFIALYLICAAVVGALSLLLYPLLEFSWWRVTGFFVLVIAGLFAKAFVNVIKQMDETEKKN